MDNPGVIEFHCLSRVIPIFTVLNLNHLALVVRTVPKNNILLFVCLREREEEEEERKGEGGERERETERQTDRERERAKGREKWREGEREVI